MKVKDIVCEDDFGKITNVDQSKKTVTIAKPDGSSVEVSSTAVLPKPGDQNQAVIDPSMVANELKPGANVTTDAPVSEEEEDHGEPTSREFKHHQMKHELGQEDTPSNRYYNPNPNAPKPVMIGMYFYDVPPGNEDAARATGLKQTKSGKWGLTKYTTSGATFNTMYRRAKIIFGDGKWWEPKKSINESVELTAIRKLSGLCK